MPHAARACLGNAVTMALQMCVLDSQCFDIPVSRWMRQMQTKIWQNLLTTDVMGLKPPSQFV